jgi:hypothetical protein
VEDVHSIAQLISTEMLMEMEEVPANLVTVVATSAMGQTVTSVQIALVKGY